MRVDGIFIIITLHFSVKCSAKSFGYTKREQHLWAQSFKQCAGKMQSPIGISTTKAVVLPLPAIEMIGFHDYLSGPLLLRNNGHSVALELDGKRSTKRLPHVFGAMLEENRPYQLEGLHFHWGNKNNRGSEHILNGVRYPMEMHIILRNMVYPNIEEALEHEDGLTVLATFFQLQEEDNASLSPILRILPAVQWVNMEFKLNITFTLSSLLPKNTDTYYTYRGSLTTPPCNEAVTWIIFSMPVPISYKQMNRFRILSTGENVLADNYRKLQSIWKRKVYMRKISPIFAAQPELVNSLDVKNLNWYWQ